MVCRRTLDIYGCEAVLIEPGLYRTDISSPSHVSNMYQLAWNDLPPQTKSDYGDEYIVEGRYLLGPIYIGADL